MMCYAVSGPGVSWVCSQKLVTTVWQDQTGQRNFAEPSTILSRPQTLPHKRKKNIGYETQAGLASLLHLPLQCCCGRAQTRSDKINSANMITLSNPAFGKATYTAQWHWHCQHNKIFWWTHTNTNLH